MALVRFSDDMREAGHWSDSTVADCIIIIIERKDLGGVMSKRLQGHLTTLKTVPKRECDAK